MFILLGFEQIKHVKNITPTDILFFTFKFTPYLRVNL